MCDEFESRKLSLEETRLQADIDAKQREITLREKEFEHKRVCDEHSRKVLFTPLTTAIIAGFLSLTTGGLTAFVGGFWSLKAQQEKNRGELDLKEKERQFQIVIKSTEDRTPEESSKNLLFFVDIGYLPDPDGKIRTKAESKDTPVITSPPLSSSNPLLERYSKLMAGAASSTSKSDTGAYSVVEHLLVDAAGKPVSPIPAHSFSSSLSPRIIVFHFTAGGSLEGVAKFMATPESRASAHILIDRDGGVIQTVPFDYVAHHVGGASYMNLKPLNNYSIGIELINWGQLKRIEDKWTSWSGIPVPESEVLADSKAGVGWQKYTDNQIQAAIGISQALVAAYPSIEDFIGHETISPGRKNDPGPAFPIEEVKRAAMTKKIKKSQ